MQLFLAIVKLLHCGGMAKKKNAAAVALAKRRMTAMSPEERAAVARSGGLAGGKARADALTPERRKAIAKKAAATRWAKKADGKKEK